jgi:mannose-6-phosphate isomerase-like protein (cupin superfamily)
MIIKAAQAGKAAVEKPRGGQGTMTGLAYIGPDNKLADSKFTMLAHYVLPEGASIGFHTHTVDEEIYLITKGSGIYLDKDKKENPVSEGDVTLCPRGEGHGLTNSGKGDLVFVAVINQ